MFEAITKTVQSVNGSTFYKEIIAISRALRKKQTNSVRILRGGSCNSDLKLELKDDGVMLRKQLFVHNFLQTTYVTSSVAIMLLLSDQHKHQPTTLTESARLAICPIHCMWSSSRTLLCTKLLQFIKRRFLALPKGVYMYISLHFCVLAKIKISLNLRRRK